MQRVRSVFILILFLALSTEDDIIICDPEREYASLVEALGGEVITVSASSPHHINALDMVEGYSDGSNPVADKSEFVLSLFEQLDAGGLGAQERSIIDRCTALVYAGHRKGGAAPTLADLRDKLIKNIVRTALFGYDAAVHKKYCIGNFFSKTHFVSNNRLTRSEERRVGKECRSRWSPYH